MRKRCESYILIRFSSSKEGGWEREREGGRERERGEREYVFSVRQRFRRRVRPRRPLLTCPDADDDGCGCHKNGCLNKNATLAPFPHLEQVFCLLEPRPFSSCRSTKGLVSRRQKTCSRFAKGARVLHFHLSKISGSSRRFIIRSTKIVVFSQDED